jgi:membrane-associated phospholipid phosphatase
MLGDSGLETVLWIQAHTGPWIARVMLPLDWSGELAFFLLVLPWIYWCANKAVGRQVALLVLFTFWMNAWLKTIFDTPRPFEMSDRVVAWASPRGGGMPSGHATISAVFWGSLALSDWLPRPWRAQALWAAGMLSVLIGVSRVVHGVHFPGDVVVGWGVGLVLLALQYRSRANVSRFVAGLTLRQRMATGAGLGAAALLISPGLTAPGHHLGHTDAVTAGGMWLGCVVGMAWEADYLGFVPDGSLRTRLIRYGIGILGCAVLYGVMKLGAHALALEASYARETVRFIRYAVLGLTLSAGAPWLFARLSLKGLP